MIVTEAVIFHGYLLMLPAAAAWKPWQKLGAAGCFIVSPPIEKQPLGRGKAQRFL